MRPAAKRDRELRVFFDANVIIAGAMSRSGASRALLLLAEAGLFKAVMSRLVIDEVERNIRLKLPTALPLMVEILGLINLEIVDNPPMEQYARWLAYIEAKDAPILEAAVTANIDYFVTLNDREFTPNVGAVSHLTIIRPGDFIMQIRDVISAGLGQAL